MDKKLLFTGIEPDVKQDQILIDAEANRPAMFAMISALNALNLDFRLKGAVVTVTPVTASQSSYTLTSGYVFFNGEILQVDPASGTFNPNTEILTFVKSVTYDPRGDKTFKDGTPRKTWQKNRAVIAKVNSIGPSDFPAENASLLHELIYNKGVDEATQTEARVGTSNNTIMTPESVKDVKTVAYGKLTTSLNPYTLFDNTPYDVVEFTTSGGTTVTMPNPSNNKNRLIVLENTNATGGIAIANTAGGGSQENQFYPDDRINGLGVLGIDGKSMSFLSDGYKWMLLHYKEFLQG